MDITYLICNSHNELKLSTHDVWNRQGEIDYWYIVKNSLYSVIMFWPKVLEVKGVGSSFQNLLVKHSFSIYTYTCSLSFKKSKQRIGVHTPFCATMHLISCSMLTW